MLAIPATCAIGLLAFVPLVRQQPHLLRTFIATASLLLVWAAVLFFSARRDNRTLTLDIAIRKHHWVQACAQGTVLLYWAWHVRFVWVFLPLVAAQVLFAFAFDSLLTWSRRSNWTLGFGPLPVILSINLFLFFKPEWFHWQFVMIALGFAAKALIHWNKEGRSAHIFNPSSFPLAVVSLVLLVTGSTDATFGEAIAATQFYPPYIYLVIFLASLPGQLLFGVARVTMPAVVTIYLISLAFFQVTGTYLFYDTHIPIAIFLGMHLLLPDPSTSPRSEPGKILFGVIYAVGTAALYVLLGALGEPTFYDKLLPVPIMNLMVRFIDRLRVPAAFDLQRPGAGLATRQRHIAYAGVWAVIFIAMSAVQGVGDRPAGQSLAFWLKTCDAGNARACNYAGSMTTIYCDNGSGWACNEWAVRRRRAGLEAGTAFAHACELGYAPACANATRAGGNASALVQGRPLLADLPIVLRGTKPPLVERDPARLYAIACEQGWPGACTEWAGDGQT
ncbi:MAG TPA: hypothetical protein VFG84_07455 [Gemmatimonadaceae bacterium]|nr:hypothetical protein [Gemmatimonadaceae bacterium]